MTNNDILRRIRFILNYNNPKVLQIFKSVNYDLSLQDLDSMLKKEDEAGYKKCTDSTLCRFLDGIIIDKRGLKEGAEIPKPSALNNNLIFKKLRVALAFKEDDIVDVFKLVDFRLTKSELGALFRAPSHKNFKECGDQILRNFLKGLSVKFRGK